MYRSASNSRSSALTARNARPRSMAASRSIVAGGPRRLENQAVWRIRIARSLRLARRASFAAIFSNHGRACETSRRRCRPDQARVHAFYTASWATSRSPHTTNATRSIAPACSATRGAKRSASHACGDCRLTTASRTCIASGRMISTPLKTRHVGVVLHRTGQARHHGQAPRHRGLHADRPALARRTRLCVARPLAALARCDEGSEASAKAWLEVASMGYVLGRTSARSRKRRQGYACGVARMQTVVARMSSPWVRDMRDAGS